MFVYNLSQGKTGHSVSLSMCWGGAITSKWLVWFGDLTQYSHTPGSGVRSGVRHAFLRVQMKRCRGP